MNAEVLKHIKDGYSWRKLPDSVKKSVGDPQLYIEEVVEYSLNHQLRYTKTSAVRHVIKDERKYYETVLQHSQTKLLLYPYHLQTKMVGLRVTPFSYYINMMEEIMNQEKSYDSLPNFTAADALRILGIGRNQYIDIMNKLRINRKYRLSMFRKIPSTKEQLPKTPAQINIEAWWNVHVSYITEEDIRRCSLKMKTIVDGLIDKGPCPAGELDYELLQLLYSRGLIFLQIPLNQDDCVGVPPLEGFVMNRVSGDYLETLMYKIFVSIDERMTIKELASVLDISVPIAENAVGIFCRLGFAQMKLNASITNARNNLHPSWKSKEAKQQKSQTDSKEIQNSTSNLSTVMKVFENQLKELGIQSTSTDNDLQHKNKISELTCSPGKRIAFLFDSSLTAFLMMGNLSSGLKNHAVTLFEVGKLTDESLNNFLVELDKVKRLEGYEGDAHRYFEHTINLRTTIRCLRHNKVFSHLIDHEKQGLNKKLEIGLDLLRCESLSELDPATLGRLLDKKYSMAFAMAPLGNVQEIPSSSDFFLIGPPSAAVNSVWFKLYLYDLVGYGPPSLFLTKGTKLRILPSVFMDYETILITSVGHEPVEAKVANVLSMLNEALIHSAVLIQGFQRQGLKTYIAHLPFPTIEKNYEASVASIDKTSNTITANIETKHKIATEQGSGIDWLYENIIVKKLKKVLGLESSCGYISLLVSTLSEKSDLQGITVEHVELLNIYFGIPLFDDKLNRDVCNALVTSHLCKNGLSKLQHFNNQIKENVACFVQRCQAKHAPSTSTTKSEQCPVELPKQCLMFKEEKVKLWNKFLF